MFIWILQKGDFVQAQEKRGPDSKRMMFIILLSDPIHLYLLKDHQFMNFIQGSNIKYFGII